MSPSFIRTISAIMSFIASWTMVVASLLYAGWMTAGVVYKILGPIWNNGAAAWNEIDMVGQFGLFLPILGAPEGLQAALRVSMQIAAGIMSLFMAIHWLRPLSWDVNSLGNVQKLERKSRIHTNMENMARRAGIKTSIRLYVLDTEMKNAFAFNKHGRAAIVITTGLLRQFDEGPLNWVVAHELGHINFGDASTSALWVAVARMDYALRRLRIRFLQILYPLLMRIPPLRLLSIPVEWAFLGLVWITDIANRVARRVFKAMDTYAQRSMEYRADAFASSLVHPSYGIAALYDLGGMLEPTFDIFASHPPLKNRLIRLKMMRS